MYGFTEVVLLLVAVFATLAATVLAIFLSRMAKPTSCGTAAAPRTSHRLVDLVSAENGGLIASEFPALSGVTVSPEVFAGLKTICQVRPEVAEHVCNLELLSRLRQVTGPSDFRFLCGQLAEALSNPGPRHYDLARGLQRGELSWNGFLKEMRSIPMGALRP